MNSQEMESLVKQLKAAGLTEEQIMETFFETFQEGKMDRKDLEALAEFMGYELTDEFKNDATPDPISGGEGVTKTEAEELKEIKPGESKEEFEEKVNEAKSEAPIPSAEGGEPKPEEPKVEEKVEEEKKAEEPAKEPEAKPEEKSEDEEWEEVQKKFHW